MIDFISDHTLITGVTNVTTSTVIRKRTMVRKKVASTEWMQHLRLLIESLSEIDNLGELYNMLAKGYEQIHDKLQPLREKVKTVRYKNKWFSSETAMLKKEKRKAEKQYLRTRSEEDLEHYQMMKKTYKKHLYISRAGYINQAVQNCDADPKKLFALLSELSGKTSSTNLPEHFSEKNLADDFAKYFDTKIEKIRSDFDHENTYVPRRTERHKLQCFNVLTDEEVRKIVKEAKPTNCDLNRIPAGFIREHIDVLLPVIKKIINLSLSRGEFIDEWKKSIVTPLQKKQGSNVEFTNYRPVNNLTYMSKLVERGMLLRLNEHIETNHLLPDYQSAYRKNYSTETLLVKLHNDFLQGMEEKKKSHSSWP